MTKHVVLSASVFHYFTPKRTVGQTLHKKKAVCLQHANLVNYLTEKRSCF